MREIPKEQDMDLLELMAGEALGDLTEDEESYLYSRRTPDEVESQQLMQTAAVIQWMLQPSGQHDLPDSLRDQIQRQADEHLASSSNDAAPRGPDSDRQIGRAPDASTTSDDDRSSTVSRREWFAWLAMAASLLIAIVSWMGRPTTPIELSFAEARAELIRSADDLIQVDWGPGKHPVESGVKGDVVWSTNRQQGFMTFDGLPVNDPLIEQYQLWIIDPERDEEPIDGGVFDVAASGEVIVPITAKLAVVQPAAFAITIEKPGGVVVSTQERLPLLAAVN